MNIVQSGDRFMIYGEDLQTYKLLPGNTYKIQFNKMMGFYLTLHNDLEVKDKVYGPYQFKVDKVLNTFEHLDRNMGVILSGPKGVGKSLFARLLSERAHDKNLPLLICNTAVPGLADFIANIDQEVIVLFDEFEKNFKTDKENAYDPQVELLSLFDGIDNGKKLFIITCNEVRGLNEFLLNRPGRFHYHFILSTPTPVEIREYMEDQLIPSARVWIDKLIQASYSASFTYDALRAIAFELNQGYDLNETLSDLNIERERYLCLKGTVIFTNGMIAKSDENIDIDLFNGRNNSEWFKFIPNTPLPDKSFASFVITFPNSAIVAGENGYTINPTEVEISRLGDDYWEDEAKDTYKELIAFKNSLTIKEISLEKVAHDYGSSSFAYKFMV